MNADTIVEAGTRLLIRVAFLVLGLWFLYLVQNVVLIIFAAVLTSAALAPLIAKIRRWGLSKTASVLLVYLGLFLSGIALLGLLVPLFISELQAFGNDFPKYSAQLSENLAGIQAYLQSFGITFDRDAIIRNIELGFTESFQGLFSTTVGIFQGLVLSFGFFFLALYLSLEENGIEKLFRILTPKPYQSYMLSVAARIQGKVSQWLFGQLLLMGVIFAIYYVGYSLMGLPYALALALFGGLLEIIPYVGPIVAAIPAVILGFLASPVLGITILLFCFVVHQIEIHFITPQIMKHSAGLSPVVLIVAALVGATLLGPIGILISIPIAMILSVFVEDFLEKKQTRAEIAE